MRLEPAGEVKVSLGTQEKETAGAQVECAYF